MIMRRKECKRHKWRVGSGIGDLHEGKIKTIGLNIWCENCDRRLTARYYPYKPLNFKFVKRSYKRKTNQNEKPKK